MKPHKHAELIKAWADGVEIQFKRPEEIKWQDAGHNPSWYDCFEYRIKPQSKPDISYKTNIEYDFGWKWVSTTSTKQPNLSLTFDGETGELKSAEVLK